MADYSDRANAREAAEGIQKAIVHDTAAVADTDILSSDISPNRDGRIFRILVSVDTSAVFNVQVSDGSSTVEIDTNEGTALSVGAGYIFDIPVDTDNTYNFQVEANANIDELYVIELPAGHA